MKSAINLLCRAAWNIVKPCSFFESIRSPNLLFLLRVLPTARLRLRFTLWRRFFLWRYIRWGRRRHSRDVWRRGSGTRVGRTDSNGRERLCSRLWSCNPLVKLPSWNDHLWENTTYLVVEVKPLLRMWISVLTWLVVKTPSQEEKS